MRFLSLARRVWRSSSRGEIVKQPKYFLISAAFLLVVLAVGVGAWLMRMLPDQSGTLGGEAAPQPLPTATVVSNCVLEHGDNPAPGPLKAKWLDRDSVRLPSVPGAGPCAAGAVPTGFAHSDTGALVAAGNWVVWVSSSAPQEPVYEAFVYPDEIGLEAIAHAGQIDVSTRVPLQLRGWVMEAPAADVRIVHVAVSVSGDPVNVASLPVVLRWDGGDWKVVFTERKLPKITPVYDLAASGYKEW